MTDPAATEAAATLLRRAIADLEAARAASPWADFAGPDATTFDLQHMGGGRWRVAYPDTFNLTWRIGELGGWARDEYGYIAIPGAHATRPAAVERLVNQHCFGGRRHVRVGLAR